MLLALANIAKNGYCTHSLAITKSSVWTELKGVRTGGITLDPPLQGLPNKYFVQNFS